MANMRDVMLEIYKAHGELTPQQLVNEARPEDHPLHHRFEWDDAKASEAYRRSQAVDLITEITITVEVPGTKRERRVRFFTSLHEAGSDTRKGYAPTEEVLKDPVMSTVLLRQAEREIDALARRYEGLQGFAELLKRKAA
jgi:hypothetical protein